MKSEHRRELHANELEKLTEAIGKFFEEYGKIVLAGLVGILVVVVGVLWYMNRGGKAKEQGSALLVTADKSDDFMDIADNPDLAKLPFTPAARVRAAELQLKDGIEIYFRDSAAGKKALKKAQSNFQDALDSDKLPTAVRERALYGLAVATETLSGRDTSAAVKAYKKLLAEFPETMYKDLAKRKIEELQTDRAKDFYAFLSTDERKPGDLDSPADQRLRQIHGGRDVTPAEKPVELPALPSGLTTNLDDPEKKPETKQPPKKKDAAKPFPPAPEKADKKEPAKTGGKSAKPPAEKKQP